MTVTQFAWLVARDVSRTLGGGLAAMELLRRTFLARGLLDEGGNAGLVAVSRLTPGTVVLAYCVGLGWSLFRWTGALAALVAASAPTSLVIVVLTVALVRVDEVPAVQMLLAIGVGVATALVFSSAWFLLRPYLGRSRLLPTGVVVLLSVALLSIGVTPVRILLLSGVAGALVGPWGRSGETR